MKDVARVAQVSPSTVSRVIQNHPSISDKTIAHVKAIMSDLGYIPNLTARSLITKKTKTIGIILKSASKDVRQNPFYSDVLHGITQRCNEEGYAIKSTISTSEESLFQEVQGMIHTHAVDGFILLFSKSNNVIKQLLIDEDVPFVVIGKPLDEKDQFIIHIDNDNEKAGHDLCSYLYHKGHRHIIFINESGQYAVTDDRSTGFRDEARQRGITHEILETENNRDSIQTLLQTYFMNEELSVRPTAIISSDGVIHHTVLSVLYNLNIQIPADVCTATFNDSLLTEMGSPPQTTVNIHPVELGNKSGEKIIQLLNQREVSKDNLWIPTTIIERESTNNMKE
ncbi:LacI family DNA-binding transcriptional regulator [Staphylococcus caprae]|nr:LacI family DNA-binding transcriptional regulator [Staphylococcus caprae]